MRGSGHPFAPGHRNVCLHPCTFSPFVCASVCERVCPFSCVCACVRACVCACVHACVCVCMPVHARTRACVLLLCGWACLCDVLVQVADVCPQSPPEELQAVWADVVLAGLQGDVLLEHDMQVPRPGPLTTPWDGCSCVFL